ncbi:MAG: DUF4123 domain-containing protein [Proteobacteria bacterium]|nr:DUF4123 domain-containing protein [Pseudomonadota bacterium]
MHDNASSAVMPAESGPYDSAPHPQAVALLDDIVAAFHRAQGQCEQPLHACLILERWEHTTAGQWLAEFLPDTAASRIALADPVYKDREDEAPCIVPLPQDLAQAAPTSEAARALRAVLPHWLEEAWFASRMRLRAIHLCGVAFTPRNATSLAVHGAQMAFQHSPVDGRACFFRFFDPRVMQRTWPTLSVAQRRAWLGPAVTLWSLEQPWGPWSFEELVASDASALRQRPRALVFDTPANADDDMPLDRQRLLDPAQWHAAMSAPVGNRAWAAYAQEAVAPDHQPGAQAMTDCIDLGARLGLNGSDLDDFVAASWNLPQGAERAAGRTPWERPPYAQALQTALTQLGTDTASRFAAVWQSHRPPTDP